MIDPALELDEVGGSKADARALIHGMPFEEWKSAYQTEATPEQMARMEESLKKNGDRH